MPYTWDDTLARYRGAGGRIVSEEQVRAGVHQAIRVGERRVRGAASAYRAGRLSLANFASIMREEIKASQLNYAALGRGGYGRLTAAEYGRIGARVKEQYLYLNNFVSDLADGTVVLDGRFLDRVSQYIRAGRTTFWRFDREAHLDAGFTLERNRLGLAEHCAECLEMSALGWVEIGELIPIGERTCRANDQCEIEYAREED